jgi:nuclear pore complex protein Nup85
VNRPEPLQYDANHYRTLYTCLSLFVVLYLPEAGFDDAPVGEELMEWLNTHFIEPSSEEGDHLSSQDRPWEDELFWQYLTRCFRFLGDRRMSNLIFHADPSCGDFRRHPFFY